MQNMTVAATKVAKIYIPEILLCVYYVLMYDDIFVLYTNTILCTRSLLYLSVKYF